MIHCDSEFSIGEFVIVACAAIMLVAFFAMPWYELENGDTVTGSQLAGDTEGDLELPVRISHMFLIVVPLAAAARVCWRCGDWSRRVMTALSPPSRCWPV